MADIIKYPTGFYLVGLRERYPQIKNLGNKLIAIQRILVDDEDTNKKVTMEDMAYLIEQELNIPAQTVYNIGARELSRFVGRHFVNVRNDTTNDMMYLGDINAVDAIAWIRSRELRLGVWCACKVARTVLVYTNDKKERPRKAIDTTEKWVRGNVKLSTVRKAESAAFTYSNEANSTAATEAAASAGIAAQSALSNALTPFGTTAATSAVRNAARAYASDPLAGREPRTDRWIFAYRLRLQELTLVISKAILTYPSAYGTAEVDRMR